MSKSENIPYTANFKEETDKESGVVTAEAMSYIGTVDYNMPDSVEEAVQMWGEAPFLSAAIDNVRIKVQAICRRNRSVEEAQGAVNSFVPGVSTRGQGPTDAQIEKFMGKMSKEKIEAMLAKMAEAGE